MATTPSQPEQAVDPDKPSPASKETSDSNGKQEQAQEHAAANPDAEHSYPPQSKMLFILASIFLVVFLTALDRLIIGVAIPSISNEFQSLGDIGWYGSAYLLTSCAFMLFMGRIYTLYNPKWVYLGSLVVFEVGSAVCGAAPNSKALIVGRAIAGLGSAGLFQGGIIIIVFVVPLHKRPQYTGLLGLVFGVASAVGPLLGGAFSDGPGWRWCFYINLPCGGAVLLLLLITLHIPAGMLPRQPTTLREKIAMLDLLGLFFFLPCVICLLLALQWGGVTYSWSSGRIIALLVVFGVCCLAFLADQWWRGDKAMVPGRIFLQRSILAGMWFALVAGGALMTMFYYIPIYFQTVKNASPTKAGIMNLPMVISLAIASVMAGFLTRATGYFAPWMILSSIMTPIASGLISTFTPHTTHPAWIGYQVLFGFGFGLGLQQPSVAAQTILSRKDVSTGASLMQFCQALGGAVFISVGNNLFDSHLEDNLHNIPGIDIKSVVETGATDLRKMVPADELPRVLVAYSDALRTAFYLCIGLSCAMAFGAVTIEWKSVKKGRQAGKQGQESGQGEKQGNGDTGSTGH
ncbi:hypothetical protein HRR83_008161 [Exophiala dermatitidis]|uniref:DNA repair protein RAD50 n=2 Tax=Exophiala dermatitidis TaxID=5970 RepID=H6BSV8_EXODN|nr:DNA repair protein RAD50 [Exophiala dermatitidis NIH/UT8656]KAJ4508000.1 hypothetical protein HRR74_007885 [Exophiala dermatitidis]EHY54262.1 DNA repair protein RAD50 [Exophiala dermatitidis NIH/UT8656]KAJ4513591.1 hypothetical protein HRR73_005749 [Exophiala dermatitidis]KAJ4535566.1 hypothetical protein HRR77_007885 [Exophiala dermatitidis]KAJ4541259.1 hypothetical protein HRR78_007606 [Exophiala dermatitidis]